MFNVQGSKDVVEFLVMNWTVVDVPGKRDTKKVKVFMTMMILITSYNVVNFPKYTVNLWR